jgi:2,3-dihydroxy-p-cumate/2,3-dihydroxybenzoate 3,4-dioxygenase
MVRYRRLSHVTLNVADVARSQDFYASLAGLDAVEPASDDEAACFSVGSDGTRLGLAAGAAPGLKRFGFEMESAAELDRLAAALERAGVPWSPTPEGLRMVDPFTSVAVDFSGAAQPAAPAPGPRLVQAIEGFGHIVLRARAYREAVAFWRDVLGFRLSDEIEGRIALLRCFPNPLHHSLGIARGERPMFHHLNFRVREEADLEAAARELSARGAAIASGPGTHAPSRSRFLYFYDPDGLTLEMSTGTERFEEGRERAPRVLPDRPESFALGDVRRDARMYTVGEIEVSSESG